MNDKENQNIEKMIDELDDEEIEDFAPADDDEPFDSGLEDVFESEEDEEAFEVNGQMDGFEEEMERDMDDDMAYSDDEEKKGFLSTMFKMPRISTVWIGILLVALALLVVLIVRTGRQQGDKNILSTQKRLNNIEEQLVKMDSLNKRMDMLSAEGQNQQQLGARLDKLEQNLAVLSGQFEKEVKRINEKIAAISSTGDAGRVEEKTADKPVAEQYHIVKKGENLYRIALRYGLTEAQLLSLNNLKSSSTIYPGQKLKITR